MQKSIQVSVPFTTQPGLPGVKFGKLIITLALLTPYSPELQTNDQVATINAAIPAVNLTEPTGDAFVGVFSDLPDGQYSATAQSYDDQGNPFGAPVTDYYSLGSVTPPDQVISQIWVPTGSMQFAQV